MPELSTLLVAEIPRLRRYARALTRNVTQADDLVQNCLTRAIAKKHLWEPGTDLRAWLFTILHNQYVNDVRRAVREGNIQPLSEAAREDGVYLGLDPHINVKPRALESLQLRDVERCLKRLPEEQRQAILLVGYEGMTYEEAAAVVCVPVGTMRSRLSRGRALLRHLIDGEPMPNWAEAKTIIHEADAETAERVEKSRFNDKRTTTLQINGHAHHEETPQEPATSHEIFIPLWTVMSSRQRTISGKRMRVTTFRLDYP